MSDHLLNTDFSALYNSFDVEEIWHFLKTHITSSMDSFIPKVRLRVQQFPVWFSPQLRHSLKYLRTLQCKYNKHPSPDNLNCLTKAQQSFHIANTSAKSVYEQSLIYNFAARKDPKIFHFIKEFTKSHVLPP